MANEIAQKNLRISDELILTCMVSIYEYFIVADWYIPGELPLKPELGDSYQPSGSATDLFDRRVSFEKKQRLRTR